MMKKSGSVIVNAGCLLFLDEHLPTSRQNDVLDSLLYIQLAASRKHPKFTAFQSWKETWLAAALRFGWVWKAGEHINEPAPRTSAETAWSLCAQALGLAVEQELLAEAEREIRQHAQHEALGLLASEALQVRVRDQEPGRTALALQLGFVDAHGSMTLAVLHLDTFEPLTSAFLFKPLQAGHLIGNLDMTVYSMRLLDQVYGQFREAFDSALAERRSGLVKRLSLDADVG